MKRLHNIADALRRCFSFSPLLIYLTAFAAIYGQLLIFRSLVFEANPWMTISPLTALGDVALILVPFALLRPRWRWTVWIAVAGMTIFCYVNLWYCRAFYDLMPADSLGMGGNMQSRVIDAFFDQLRAADWLMIVPTAAFALVWILLHRRAKALKFALWSKITLTASALILYGGAYMVRAYDLYDVNRKLGSYPHMLANYYRYSGVNAYKFTQHLRRMGYVWYMGWQLDRALIDKSLDRNERSRIDSYWEQQRQLPRAAARFSANRSKNLIFIIVESLASDAIGAEIAGVAVAPTLDSLASDSTAIVFRRMQAQVNHGRSSDGQFIYNTGLLPLRNNVVAKRFPSANYPSIAKALGYKHSSEVVGEKPTFYNHSITNLSYGYSGFVPAQDAWLSDKQILDNAITEIDRLRQPFYCEITTLDTHDPYNHKIPSPTAISSAEGYDPRDLNYFEQIHIFDGLLADFLAKLKARGLYDNSVIVIASDHEPRRTALSEDGPISSDIFLLILNSGLSEGLKSNRIVGQVDVMPTILDVMGVEGYKYPGLGHSLLGEPDHFGAVDAFGSVYGQPADSARLEEAWQVSSLMIEGGYFKK